MGESGVKAPDVQNKMRGSVSPHEAVEVSISFGRFENDSLSWEKWSTFSPNKYLEEVEKCSTPGSVAQKKAHFEAHYKKIAARKAELLEQENIMGTDSSGSNEMNCSDRSTSNSGADIEGGILHGQSFAQEVGQDSADAVECQKSLVESATEGINDKLQSEELIPKNADLVTEEILRMPEEGEGTDKQPLETGSEMINVMVRKEKTELRAHNTSQKVPQPKKEQNLARVMKQKPMSPAAKLSELSTSRSRRLSKPMSPTTPRSSKKVPTSTPRLSKLVSTSTPRLSKPVSASTPNSSKPVSTPAPRLLKQVPTSTPRLFNLASASPPQLSRPASASTSRLSKSITTPIMRSVSQSSTRKQNISSAPEEIKRASPSSLHKSLNSGSLTTTRKSLVMEQMGDKDSTRRGFKSFQNNLNQLKPSCVEKPCGPRPVSARGSVDKILIFVTSRKENERTRMAQRNHVRRKRTTTLSRSLVETGFGKTMKQASSSVRLQSEEKDEKRKAKPGGEIIC